MQNCRALVNQQGNQIPRWRKWDEEHPPCSTIPTEPKGVKGLCFSDLMPALSAASATSCALPVKTSVIHS